MRGPTTEREMAILAGDVGAEEENRPSLIQTLNLKVYHL